MDHEEARSLLALGTILGAAVPVYFFWFWRWFHFWREHRVLTYLCIALTFTAAFIPAYIWRNQVLAHRFDFPLWVRAIGWIVMIVWTVIGTIADRQIGMHVRSFGPHFARRERIRLRTTGAYGIVRHPIYSAGIFFSLSTFLVTGYPAVLASSVVLTLGAFWFTRREEERTMALLDDPGEYERYRKRVPALFPRLWPRSRTASPDGRGRT